MQSNDQDRLLGRRVLARAIGACTLASAGSFLLSGGAAAVEPVSGRVTIEQVQVSLLVSAGWGTGTLSYMARQHPFHIKGLGVGGLGVTKLEATGVVYRLKKIEDFPGLYGSVRAGAVAGDKQLKGGLWLENPAGVQMNLVPRRQGLALNLGADGILVTLDT